MSSQSFKMARNLNGTCGRLLPTAWLAALAGPCQAGTSAPFDLGNLVLYAVGLIVLVAMSFFSRTVRYVAYAWVAIPLVFLLAGQALDRARVKDRAGEDPIAAALAHSRFCQSRQRQVVSQITRQAGATGHALLVRVDSAFPLDQQKFKAVAVADRLQKFPANCGSTGLSSLEELLPNASGMAIHFPACSSVPTEERKTAPSLAQYELIVGETNQRDQARENSRYDLRSASIRIADRRSGQTLATDTMYFLNGVSGGANCPNAEDQLAELIALVFSSAR